MIGKGRRPRALPFGQQTGLALGRYLRTRARERQADRSELWLAEKNRGALSSGGIGRMLRRRGDAVGIPGLHAHQFRHTAAYEWLAANGSETDLMRLMGWRSPQMLRRYGASIAAASGSRRAGDGLPSARAAPSGFDRTPPPRHDPPGQPHRGLPYGLRAVGTSFRTRRRAARRRACGSCCPRPARDLCSPASGAAE